MRKVDNGEKEKKKRKRKENKLGLSCAKLRPALASYQLAFVWLDFTEAAYYD